MQTRGILLAALLLGCPSAPSQTTPEPTPTPTPEPTPTPTPEPTPTPTPEPEKAERSEVLRSFLASLDPQLAQAGPPTLSEAHKQGAAGDYADLCAPCHGAGGAGDGPANANIDPTAPALAGPAALPSKLGERFELLRVGADGAHQAFGLARSTPQLWALALHIDGLEGTPAPKDPPAGQLVEGSDVEDELP